MALASASEGESPGQEAILVLGCAGAGKSSFIATATGLGVRIGHGPEVCKLQSYSGAS